MTLNPIPRNAKGGLIVLACVLILWGVMYLMGWV